MTQTTSTEQPGTWLAEIARCVWAMEPTALMTLTRLAEQGALGEKIAEERAKREQAQAEAKEFAGRALFGADVDASDAKRPRGRPRAIQGSVETISLKGVLAPVSGLLALFFDLENPLVTFERKLREAVGDPDIGAVVIDIDSPGGVVDGIPEAAAAIRSLRGTKPIVAVANTMAASAAYWLASQADEVSVTPSGEVGSIGVYMMHRDMSGFEEKMGAKTTLVSAGKFKTEGNPFEPLSDEAREHAQEAVDYYYDLFTKDVALGRDVKQSEVKAGYGEGRVLTAEPARKEGLVDRVETIGEAQARLAARSRGGRSNALGAEADVPEPDTEPVAEADAGADHIAEAEDEVAYSREERARILDALGV